MTLNDIVNRAAVILGIDEELGGSPVSRKEELLCDSANAVLAELTLEFVHLTAKEKLTFEDGRLYYSAFSKDVREVLAVTQNGKRAAFTMYPLYVEASGTEGEAEVKYLYHLGDLQKADTVLLPPQYTAYLLGVGTAAEFAYRTGLVDEAVFYRNRFETAVQNLERRLKPARMPMGRFL